MRRGSIALRLLLLSGTWLVIALVATAFLLTDLYARALDRDLLDNLNFQVESLVGQALQAPEISREYLEISDGRYNRPTSGYYWLISDEANQTLAFSPSLIGSILPELNATYDDFGLRVGEMTDGFGNKLRVLERKIVLSDVGAIDVLVSGNLSDMEARAIEFRSQVFVVLAVVGIILALMSFMLAHIALRPIENLREAVEAVREGDSQKLEGKFPLELSPLADEVNQLLLSNTQIIERARAQVGNLAHGLKTPLAVIRNEAESEKNQLSRSVLAQTDNMNRIVSTYLDKARLSARTSIVGKKSDSVAVLERLGRVMSKLHKTLDIEIDISPSTPYFRGDESDLEEIVGNILDNACKWGRSQIRLTSMRTINAGNRLVHIIVEDDGPGLTETQVSAALRRGVRLDEKTPGSGLGLDIVKELVDVYSGELTLTRSELGGLRADIQLPAARDTMKN